MKRKLCVFVMSAMLISCSMLIGCGRKDNKTSDTKTEIATVPDAVEVATAMDDMSETDMSVGRFEGDTIYVNDAFDFMIELPDNRWRFETTDNIADYLGVDKNEIDSILNGEISVYDKDISYLAVACNDQTGSNVIVCYFCPDAAGVDSNMTAEEYIRTAGEQNSQVTLGSEELAGYTYSTMTKDNGETCTQKIMCRDKDGIILMITITDAGDEKSQNMIKNIKKQ